MTQSLVGKYVVPFFLWYGMMIISTIIIDYILHYFDIVHLGRDLGFSGTVLIILSFIYSLRKRKIISTGPAKQYLNFHEYIAWLGSVLILVHAGIHYNALLPWLAILMLLVNVASGLIGKFLLKKASEDLGQHKKALLEQGKSKLEVDNQLHFDILTVDALKQWRKVHLPITFLFATLSIIHIVAVYIF